MSIVRMKQGEGAQSGGAMDREVKSRKLSPKARIGLAIGGLVLLVALLWYFMPAGNSQTVDAARLTIGKVTQGRFDDFLPLRAQVQPSQTVFLDAVEGGRVERVLVEDGAMVHPGPDARRTLQFRSPAQRARPPDRGDAADQLECAARSSR